MRGCGFAYAPLAATEENEFGTAHETPRSSTSSMICWTEITLPPSRVRSEAFRTYLVNSALLGRRVMGTVSGSGLIFLAFDRAGTAAGALASVAGDTNTGVAGGTDFAPTGWLAAAASRAARSLESLLFFIRTLFMVARWCGVTIARLHNIATPSRHECPALQCFAVEALQEYDTEIAQRCSAPMSNRSSTLMPQHCASRPLYRHAIVALRRHALAPSQLRGVLASYHYSILHSYRRAIMVPYRFGAVMSCRSGVVPSSRCHSMMS